MIFYLTYNDAPSGIFSSQVIDVVNFMNGNVNADVKLVSFLSIRNFGRQRKKIKKALPGSIVLPMFPKLRNWKKNSFLLSVICRIYKPTAIIGRSVMATGLALNMRDKKHCRTVVYDGRGAIEAEWTEYKVVTDPELLAVIGSYEKEAVIRSDFRIAVSLELVQFWKNKFDYKANDHVLIPCTLNSQFQTIEVNQKAIDKARKNLHLENTDIVFVYSGSVAGWQSFELLSSFIEPLLTESSTYKIIFFSRPDVNIEKLIQQFPEQVQCNYLEPHLVGASLIAGDYGLLIREQSLTNTVASPVKYAEYLSCGLKVVISSHLGDYSELTQQKNWGYKTIDVKRNLLRPHMEEKEKISMESKIMFSKAGFLREYSKIKAICS